MSYATGSATAPNDLITAIKNFALADGWTIDKNVTNLLFMHKGLTYIAIEALSYTYQDYATGVAVTTTDWRFDMALSTGITVGLSTYFGHPGSLSTTALDLDRVCVNHLLGPFSEYHIFSGASGGANYIMMAVKTGADTWRQFGFGEIDKGSFTHGGAAFIAGSCGYFYRHNAAPANTQFFNNPASNYLPFMAIQNSALGDAGVNLYVPDALPNTADWPVMRAGGIAKLLGPKSNLPSEYPSISTNPLPCLLNPLMGAVASQWAGNIMMFPMPILVRADTPEKCCYIGDYPGVRAIFMAGLQSGQELALGGDTWKVFSVGRLTAPSSAVDLGFQYSTGQYGLAFKKNV